MNLLDRRKAELRIIATELMERLHEAILKEEDFDSVFWLYARNRPRRKVEPIELTDMTRNPLAAVMNLIRDHVRGNCFCQADIAIFKDMLNSPISEVIPVGDSSQRQRRSEERKSGNGRCYRFGDAQSLCPKTPGPRFVADKLLQYLECFQREPKLVDSQFNPIGVCDQCDRIFLKGRGHGRYCSAKCRSANWHVTVYPKLKDRINRSRRKKRKQQLRTKPL